MNERYDSAAAQHYAAYRPPLHGLILERLIRPGESFRSGLDVGCGTGYSAVTLASYCDRVVGLDPSQPMLNAARKHSKVTYFRGSGENLSQFPPLEFDVVSFAGSLVYAKTNQLRSELARGCRPAATVLVYDFEVVLGDILGGFGLDCLQVASEYDHNANFSDWPEFVAEASGSERVPLDFSEEETAHVLLSDSNRYDVLVARFPRGDLFASVVEQLRRSPAKVRVYADIYYARYRLLRKQGNIA